MLLPGYVRLGRLHLPVYGVFAAVGLLSALWLSQKTAERVGIASEKLWDAGVFAVVAAFAASRLLLVLGDVRAFLRYPLLVLALPSLTYGGMVLATLLVAAYLVWKRLPLLSVMDAWAPCAALLAAVLQVGHFVEGTDAGMPTHLPWGVRLAGDTVLGKVHPVQWYAALAASALMLWSLGRLHWRRFPGEVSAGVLWAGAATAFLLDFLRQPQEAYGQSPLEADQIAALVMVFAGGALYVFCERSPGKNAARSALRSSVAETRSQHAASPSPARSE